MYQFYVLAIVFNILGGLTLAFDFLSEHIGLDYLLNDEGFTDDTVRLVVGLGTLVVGLVKLFVVTGDNWIILGDFVPALTAVVTGFTLLLERFREALGAKLHSERGVLLLSRLDGVFIQPRNVYGILSVIAGLAHLFLYSFEFL